MTALEVIRAAGVVLLREGERGREVLVIHRPHRQDWSLPKGKLDPGEHPIAAAVRETIEEAAIVPRLGMQVGSISYESMSRAKTVDYWVATPGDELKFAPNDEIDERRWIPVDDCESLLTFPHDAEIVHRAASLPSTIPLVLLRHTQAVKRVDFKGAHDKNRPISAEGKAQAKALVPMLSAYGVRRVYSSDAVRCMESVRRFAEAEDLRIRLEPELSEEGHKDSAKAAARRMRWLLRTQRPMLVCSHRPVLPTLVDAIKKASGADGVPEALDPRLQPGSFIAIHRAFDEAGAVTIIGADRYDVG